tara:strand:- start:104 stop:895 length:792 start_codon:yes stop_codon:yes gene_type:complete
MKFNDDITLDIANAVSNVMEGKPAPVKFNVVDKDGEVVKGFNTKEAANKYVVDNRDKQVLNIVVAEVDEPRVPDGNMGSKMGERGFKGKHAVKKSGENPDGSVTKEEVEVQIDEAVINERLKKKPGRGKTALDIDFIGDNKMRADAKRKYKVDIKPTGSSQADIKGDKKQVLAFLQDPEMYGMDDEDIEEFFPELFEAKKVEEDETEAAAREESEKQKKYQAFFQKALKKFGVKSPGELDDNKKKEFFNYVDKNYDAGEGESD